MKANELMIGDWVRCYHPTCEPKQTQVNAGLLINLVRQELGVQMEESPLFRIVEPIQLTEEILERNGFKRDDKHEYSVMDSYYNYLKVRCYDDTYYEIGNAVDEEGELQAFADIQYVHELQHALRLCGIEKEIEL